MMQLVTWRFGAFLGKEGKNKNRHKNSLLLLSIHSKSISKTFYQALGENGFPRAAGGNNPVYRPAGFVVIYGLGRSFEYLATPGHGEK
jgi:hypothetical protein